MKIFEIGIPQISIKGVDWVERKSSGSGGSGGGDNQIPDTTVIRLNQTISDPYSMLSGEFGKDGTPETNVVSWIRANSHRYVGNYDAEQGMVLRQLDDNDSTKYADGSDASEDIKGTNGGDVFMKMPDFWFKGDIITSNDGDIVDMLFSAKEPADNEWIKWDGNTLIGAYKTVAEDTENNTIGGLFSRSGVTPSVNISQVNLKIKARNRSVGNDHFMIVTHEAHRLMAVLSMAYYGNTYIQTIVGSGTASYPKVTGQTNVDGMNDTVVETTKSINFWGLENWWGDIREMIDNIILYDNKARIHILDYDGNVVDASVGATISGFISKMIITRTLQMIPKRATDGTATSYYCTKGAVSSKVNSVGYRSEYANNKINNPFTYFINSVLDDSGVYNGTRLLYHGRVTIANTPLRMRSIATPWKPIDLQYVYRNNIPVLRTGFDFNICNVFYPYQVGKLSLYGLNIDYDKIEFSDSSFSCDKDGNITLDTDILPESVDMNFNGQYLGSLKFYGISEEQVIEYQRKETETLSNPHEE